MFAPRLRKAMQGAKTANAIHGDGWDGYPASFLHIVRKVHELKLQNLYMLSGDAHLCCKATITVQAYGQAPLHFWLPDAHANAPAPVSGVLSGLVLKASLFIILRLWFFVFAPVVAPQAGQLLSGLGAATILWGSIQAIRQRRVKRLIAYSTVAQVGYLFLVFGLAGGAAAMPAWRGAAYFAFAHACAKAAAFLVAGALMHAAGGDELDRWEGLARREPMLMFTFGLAGVSLMGLPPSGGFIAARDAWAAVGPGPGCDRLRDRHHGADPVA